MTTERNKRKYIHGFNRDSEFLDPECSPVIEHIVIHTVKTIPEKLSALNCRTLFVDRTI